MCGIAGVFGVAAEDTVRAMLSTIVHRGPDDGHVVGAEEFSLGARRLSIMDVAGGRQPMANETETVWAAQNGELYNFKKVRADLVTRGHTLRTHCDTETLPHLYEEHGAAFVEHIDGMFAVAIWDRAKRVGYLARDRMGEKPLYWTMHGGALWFASEIKALLRIPGLKRKIRLESLHHYLGYKHVPAPLTIFEGIYQLPPAHMISFAAGAAPVVRRYWHVSFGTGDFTGATEEELVDRTLELLGQGIERRLMSDVPLGFFLSGGVDSSLTVALAAERSTQKLDTFTLTYARESSTKGKDEDQRWARYVAERYGTRHHEEEIASTHFPDALKKIIGCFDEPFAAAVSPYFLASAMRKHVTVALSGDGADELFGSYLSHRLAQPVARFPEYERTGDAALLGAFDGRADYLRGVAEPSEAAWRAKLLVFSEEQKRGIYTPETARAMAGFDTTAHLGATFDEGDRDPLNRILGMEFRTFFPDQLLTLSDRLSMAHSLEVRTVYLDTDFVEFAASLPGDLKIRGAETKYLLKQAARRYLPDEMIFRPKEGFHLPISQWLQTDLETYVRDTLHPDRIRRRGIFDADRVGALVDSIYGSTRDYMEVNKVYSLLVFEEWYEQYMTG